MGSLCTNVQSNDLIIATLNYSGILNSPFEFFSGDNVIQQTKLSEKFQELLKQLYPSYTRESFKWSLGKIDQKIQKERYTPLYRKNCGVINIQKKDKCGVIETVDKRLIISEQQFQKIWQQQFNIALKINPIQYTEDQKKRTKQFDLLCYKSIIYYLYKVNSLKQINDKQTSLYQELMQNFFSKSFLNEQKKIKKTIDALEKKNIDIMFLQQASKSFKQFINKEKYQVISKQKVDSLIIIQKKKFIKIYDSEARINAYGPENKKKFSWNSDTIIGFVDDYVLISGHLSSKPQKNKQQVRDLINTICSIKNMHPDLNIIVGCDANTNIQPIQGFNIYPNDKGIKTTYKKRTMLQPQLNKAYMEIKECKDYLITNQRMTRCRVTSIIDVSTNAMGYLPCDNHPYDHFVVMGSIDLSQKKK